LTASVVKSYHEACPLKNRRAKNKNWWFNSELCSLKRACNRAWNRRAADGLGPLRSARMAYKAACRKAQRDSWRAFCESVDGVSPTARLHKILSKDNLKQVDTLRLPNGECINEESEVLKCLLSTHFPECVESLENVSNTSNFGVHKSVWHQSRRIDSHSNFRRAILSFHPYKSAGMDGIFPGLLQYGVDILVNPLHEIFTASLSLGYIPSAWQQVKVVFIPKL
jgi:hypothetical protein